MNLLIRLVVPAWLQALVRASPYIVLGLLIAAIVVERRTVIRVTGERDRIIRVVDPTGRATPDQAIVVAQRVVTERDAARTALTVTTANYRRATAQAQAADLTHARAVEQRDAAITGKVQHDLEVQLASARSDADAYARRLRTTGTAAAAPGADQGSGGAAGVSRPADPTSGAPGARPPAELDDARACATGIVVAEGWQRWWGEVMAARR